MLINTFSPQIPLTQLLKGKALKYTVIISIFIASIIVATSTSIGFPYQDESTGNPVVQRHYVVVSSGS